MEKAVIICMLEENAELGGHQAECTNCKKPVRITPATLQSIGLNKEIEPWCLQCTMDKKILEGEDVNIQTPSTEQMRELAKYFTK